MSDLIRRSDAIDAIMGEPTDAHYPSWYAQRIKLLPSAKPEIIACGEGELSAEPKTDGDVGEVSDGYHTFNQLYHQRAVLFATIVKQNKEKAWKSWKHEDGKFCFDSNKEWFIVGVDTPEGSYTYHYEKKYWDMFDCVELEHGKFWDGHTEEDVTRLLSLPSAEPKTGEWILDPNGMDWNIPAWRCSECGFVANYIGVEAKGFGNNPMNWAGSKFCPQCGARITGYER